MANGDIKKMGQLFLDNYAQNVNSTINAPHYNYTPNFTFKDTDDYTKQHNWVEFNEERQKKYICTNGIFYGAKYNDLIKSFKNITLDGELYELRVPTESEILYLYENNLFSYKYKISLFVGTLNSYNSPSSVIFLKDFIKSLYFAP